MSSAVQHPVPTDATVQKPLWGQNPEQRQQLEFVARGFEALLLYQLLRPLQQPLFGSMSDSGEAEGLGTGGLDEVVLFPFAEFLSFFGQGIGIARWLYRYWTGEELPVHGSSLSAPRRIPSSSPQQVPQEREGSPAESVPERVVDRIRAALRPYWEWIQQVAEKANLPSSLVAAVVWVESAGNPQAVSPAGAQGLMQLMPQTARMLGVTDPFDPRQNLEAGSRYLRQLMERFGELRLALAAYNAGPGRVQRYGGIPPFAETQTYVRRVIELYRHLEAGRAPGAPAPL